MHPKETTVERRGRRKKEGEGGKRAKVLKGRKERKERLGGVSESREKENIGNVLRSFICWTLPSRSSLELN